MTVAGRRILIVLDVGRIRRWHYDLLTELDESGAEVWITWSASVRRQRRAIRDRLSRHLRWPAVGDNGGSALVSGKLLKTRFPDRMVEPSRCPPPSGPPDVVVRLDVGADAEASGHFDADVELVVTFDGVAGDVAATASAAHGHCPRVEVVDNRAGGAVVTGGRPGSDLPSSRSHLADGVASGARVILEAALGGRTMWLDDVESQAGVDGDRRSTCARLARCLGGAVYRRVFYSPHWRVGWRFVDSEDVVDRGSVDGFSWTALPDDGFHFYADPFPVERDGKYHIFVEDFDHRLGRGVISAVEIGPDGPLGHPQPVIESDTHLSYPWIGEDEGELWMIPESAGTRTLELYRAVRYPYEWQRHTTLIQDTPLRDATPFQYCGRWWMTATVCHGGSASDTLHVWSAPRLRGPWSPHLSNPVLVDIAAARPAGRVIEREGRILRPVQDGRRGYGASMGIAEITRLDDGGFEQRMVTRLPPGGTWPGTRLHTVNRAGRLECVDGSARSTRFRRARLR